MKTTDPRPRTTARRAMLGAALLVAGIGCGQRAAEVVGGETASAPASAAATADSVADWSEAFEAEGAVGTMVLLDTQTGRTTRHNPSRAATRVTPASTSKIFNSLVFLDRGVITDVDSLFEWDGVERRVGSWNRDHTLRTGIEVSAVWLFQRAALQVGREGYDAVFAREPYGNSTMGEPLEMAWLDGSLRISADEQVVFLDRLRKGDLLFSAEDQATVRGILPVLAEAGAVRVVGKTGWAQRDGQPDLGWLVGWVERPAGDPDEPGQAVVFAMNAEAAPGATFDVGPRRLRIVRAILGAEGLWPADPGEQP